MFKQNIGVKTLAVATTPGAAPTFTFLTTELNGCGWFLVVGCSCTDANGNPRWMNLGNDTYSTYISGTTGAEAVNGHAVLAMQAKAIDEANLLEAGATYDWGRLTGITGPISNAYLTIVAFN